MSKMLQQFSIEGADAYLIASTFIFITFFCVVGYRVWKMTKAEVKELENIPLD